MYALKTNHNWNARREEQRLQDKRHQRAVEKKDFFETKRGSHDVHPLSDPFVEQHFLDWLAANRFDDERDEIALAVSNLLAEDPDLVRDHSWSEITRMAGCL